MLMDGYKPRHEIDAYKEREYERMNLDKTPWYFWLLLVAVMALGWFSGQIVLCVGRWRKNASERYEYRQWKRGFDLSIDLLQNGLPVNYVAALHKGKTQFDEGARDGIQQWCEMKDRV